MDFTKLLWQQSIPLYYTILQHPFIQELQQGTLAVEKFNAYLQQDALYLVDYARALAIAGTKADNPEDFLTCLNFANEALTFEIALHQQFFEKFKITPALEKSLSCFTYTNFLLNAAAYLSFPEIMAALLPCFWIYHKVGLVILHNSIPNNPYQAWVETYAGQEFEKTVIKAIAMANQAAQTASSATRQKMQQLFITSTKLELAFWDEAYQTL